MSIYLHPESLSPDPLYGREGQPVSGQATALTVYPHHCLRVYPPQEAAQTWGERLHLHQDPGPLVLTPDEDGRLDLVVDFGTELEAELELVVVTTGGSFFVSFGEGLPEAETWGIPTTNPYQTVAWPVRGPGTHRQQFAFRGFRFVRVQAHDLTGAVTVQRLVANAWFAGQARQGDFQCSDPKWQRVWQTSAYTARLCTRSDRYWDGIKRDRYGWFGDARIIQAAMDLVFPDPTPARQMLLELPTAQWVTGIPGFSFDALAMFRHWLLHHPVAPAEARAAYARMRDLLAWVRRTQTTREGFIKRDDRAQYFGKIAFVDWSPMPVGGRFEELSWLQCKYVEALRNAAWIAGCLGESADAARWRRTADRLARKIMERFWRPGHGLVHTLNQTTRQWEPLVVLPLVGDNDFRRHYFENPPLGESGPSRHANTLAAWAGLLTTKELRQTALRVFRSRRLPVLITPYFRYYENSARALCGDPTGAVVSMGDYVAEQVLGNDSATVWEWYDPAVQDLGKWALGDWPKSLCHGWGSGFVPLAARWLLGVEVLTPGFGSVRLAPAVRTATTFSATIPTPHGPLRVCKPGAGPEVEYEVPAPIQVAEPLGSRVVVRRR